MPDPRGRSVRLKRIRGSRATGGDHTRLAHEGIRRLLFANEIVPGQKLCYRAIAERLGMSLTPVVQALKILECQGLVRHTPNKGYHAETLSLQEVREIYELREVLECSLLPRVIEGLDAGSIDRLRDVLERSRSETADLGERLLTDREFHTLLASVSGQRVQMQVLENLFDLLYLKYRGSLLFVTSETVVGSMHQMIFDAVVTRDVRMAGDAMKRHFAVVKDRALTALSRLLAGKTPDA
jgi:DNA-binding GntR family transcriptional regulator